MKRLLLIVVALLALALVPCLLYAAITRLDGAQTAQFSFWAPIGVLVADALLFFVALGLWPMRAWDRAGLAIVLPLLIAMASWGSMMGMVEAQRAQLTRTAPIAEPIDAPAIPPAAASGAGAARPDSMQ